MRDWRKRGAPRGSAWERICIQPYAWAKHSVNRDRMLLFVQQTMRNTPFIIEWYGVSRKGVYPIGVHR